MKKIIFVILLFFTMSFMTFTEAFAEEISENKDISGISDLVDKSDVSSIKLKIDNNHTYDSMPQSYSDGYEPEIIDDYAIIILPLYCDSVNPPVSVDAGINLGDISSTPFIVKNYEKTIPLAEYESSDGNKRQLYLVCFTLAMKPDRVNGTYPVDIEVKYENITETFKVYLTINNGIETDIKTEEPTIIDTEITEPADDSSDDFSNPSSFMNAETTEPVILPPKTVITSVEGNTVKAGDIAELHIAVKNTSEKEDIKNLTAKISSASEYFILNDDSDTVFVDEIKRNGTKEIVYKYLVKSDAPSGSETINLSFSYYYANGISTSESSSITLNITQDTQVEFSDVIIPNKVTVSDSLDLNIQAINLGKNTIRNVRAVIECDGLYSSGAAFIGEIQGESSAESTLNVSVSSKSGAEMYGKTNGKIIFYYTDSDGAEHVTEQEFETVIASPFTDYSYEETEQTSPKYWIYIMGAIISAIIALVIYLVSRFRKRD